MKYGKYLLTACLFMLLLAVTAGAAGYEVVVDFSAQSARGETITYVSEEHRLFAAKLTTYPQEDQYGIYDFDGNLLLTLEEGVIPHFTPVGITAESQVGEDDARWGFYSYDLDCLLLCEYEKIAVFDENTLILQEEDPALEAGPDGTRPGRLFRCDLRTGAQTEVGIGRLYQDGFAALYHHGDPLQDFLGRPNVGPLWLWSDPLPPLNGPLGLVTGNVPVSPTVFNRDGDAVLEQSQLQGIRASDFYYGWDGKVIYFGVGYAGTADPDECAHLVYSGRGRFLHRWDHVKSGYHIFVDGQYFAVQALDGDWQLLDLSGDPVALPEGAGEIRGNCVRTDGWGGYECYTDNNYLLIVDGLGILRVPEIAPQPSEWAAADTAEAVELGLVDEDIRWWWQDSCTREEFCRILVHGLERITGKTTAELTEGLALPAFSDCDSEAVRTAAALGIVQGVGHEKFAPIRFVRRQEAAAMLSRAAQYLGYDAEGDPAMFADADQFDDWAQEPIAYVSALLCGPDQTPLMQGKSENRFAPRDPYTVEQAAITVLRLAEK